MLHHDESSRSSGKVEHQHEEAPLARGGGHDLVGRCARGVEIDAVDAHLLGGVDLAFLEKFSRGSQL